jgi:hypothetical protein
MPTHRNREQEAAAGDDYNESGLSVNMAEPDVTYHDPDIPNDVGGIGKRTSPSLIWPFVLISRSNLIQC